MIRIDLTGLEAAAVAAALIDHAEKERRHGNDTTCRICERVARKIRDAWVASREDIEDVDA